MKRMNLWIDSNDLKQKLQINNFAGEGSFKKNANVKQGTCIPVLLLNNNKEQFICTMKWGIDLFNKNRNKTSDLIHNVRIESLRSNKESWKPFLSNRAIIICKGFYIWKHTSIISIQNRRKTTNKEQNAYHVTPVTNDLFYIPAVYKATNTGRGMKFSVAAISQPAYNHFMYVDYNQERIPVLIDKNDINKWLNINNTFDCLETCQYAYGNFKEIGLWVNEPFYYKDENVVLQSRVAWDIEQDNALFNYDEIDFEELERNALEQNKVNKRRLSGELELNVNENSNNLRKRELEVEGGCDGEGEPDKKRQKLNDIHACKML